MDSTSLPLHECHTLKTSLIINRLHMFFTGISILALFYYRATTLSAIIKTRETPLIPYLIVFISEIVLTCKWVLRRSGRWRPVKRSVYLERLPGDEKLPAVDVFICTADPSKEPSLGVMNTVISAMALDYPADKLAVYLSDDGGSYVTLDAMREAWKFGKLWVPFCRKYNLKTRCPDAYFLENDKYSSGSSDFEAEKIEIEKRYEEFREALEKNSVNASGSVSRDHPPVVEVMNQEGMPYLVYVAREKRPSHPHHFKGGALNTLLKVSAVISNAPYFLVLDCDHFCNDPSSARQAMCFYLDPKISSKIAWVQFPQKFHNTSKHDIYTGQLHHVWREGLGWDGLMGPSIYGCNFYMSREAIYGGANKIQQDVSLLKKSFGSSNEFIKSIDNNSELNISRDGKVSDALQGEIQLLASSSYDNGTEWGEKVGYAYFTVVEDSITSLNLHCQGWISVYVDPKRPCFLGSCTTSMNDMLVQQTRWSFGLTQIALSKYCPLFYGPSKMSILQTMGYVAFTFEAVLYTIPFYGLGIIPQICLLHNIPLYPKVSDPYFIVFAFIFISSQLKHVQEVFSYGDSFMVSLYELRVWMMKSASCYFYATINAFLDSIGLHEANFSLTNKVVDDEQVKRYEEGIYDFQVAPLLIIPCCVFYILNLISFTVGVGKIVGNPNGGEMFVQAFISLFGIIVNYHLFEGMVLRQDKGRISPYVSGISVAVSAVILGLGFLILI